MYPLGLSVPKQVLQCKLHTFVGSTNTVVGEEFIKLKIRGYIGILRALKSTNRLIELK
jgi:hypothetical protein